MNETFYTLGNFTLGVGSCGFGPSFDTEEQMEQIIKNVNSQHVYTTLIEYGDVVLKQNPTISAGDVKISLDNGSFSDITTLPTVIGGYKIDILLSQAETNCSQLQIIFKDQTSIPEWNDKVINISTTQIDYNTITAMSSNLISINGVELSAATLPLKNIVIDNYEDGDAITLTSSMAAAIRMNGAVGVRIEPTGGPAMMLRGNIDIQTNGAPGIQVSSQNAPAMFLNSNGGAPVVYIGGDADGVQIVSETNAVSVISNTGNALYLSGASDKRDIYARELPADISSLSTSAQSLAILSAVGLIPTDNNGITVSASNFYPTDLTPVTSGIDYIKSQIDNTSYGLSAIKTQLDATVGDVLGSNIDGMTMEDAMTKILAWATGKTEYANNVFTYFKQDNATSAFALSAADTNRTRL